VTKFPLDARAGVVMPLREFDVARPQRVVKLKVPREKDA
jgi:hypothetical protein